LGRANIVQEANREQIESASSGLIITYGMGLYWSKTASNQFPGRVEILDLRTLNPLDWDAVVNSVTKHNRAMIVTEEPLLNSFAESLAGRISNQCFEQLDAPVMTIGSENLPAVPLNVDLEKMMLPNADKVAEVLDRLLKY